MHLRLGRIRNRIGDNAAALEAMRAAAAAADEAGDATLLAACADAAYQL